MTWDNPEIAWQYTVNDIPPKGRKSNTDDQHWNIWVVHASHIQD